VNLEKLGILIHNKREEAGIPLSKAAKRASIGRSTLWIIERGENPQTGRPSQPSKDILERLAEVLHMSQAETQELLSLADYAVARPATGQSLRQSPSSAPVIFEAGGTVYYAYNGHLEAFDAQTGQPRWDKPAYIRSTVGEAAPLLPREDISPQSPGRQASKRQRIRDTEPLSPEKRAARLSPAHQPVLQSDSGAPDTSGKKKRQF
jgi:transcriptional regulator with XRE-family HTH domain